MPSWVPRYYKDVNKYMWSWKSGRGTIVTADVSGMMLGLGAMASHRYVGAFFSDLTSLSKLLSTV